MGAGSPFPVVIVMRSRPAVSLPSGLPGMTTPFQRSTARRICIAYSARLTERLAAASYVARMSLDVRLASGLWAIGCRGPAARLVPLFVTRGGSIVAR